MSRADRDLHPDLQAPLPSIECPLPPLVHEEVATIQEASVRWAEAVGLAVGPRAEARVRAAKIGWLAARGFPRATTWALQLAADWTTYFCMLDDHIEALACAGEVESRLAGLRAVFDAGAGAPEDPFATALADLRRRMDAGAPAPWIGRFAARLDALFATFVAEAAHRERRQPPALAEYLPLREVSVGLHVLFTFSELTDGVTLPESIRTHPAIVGLERRASNLVGWANDLLTHEKEVAQGEVLNLVVVLQAEAGCSTRDALARVIERHNAEMRAFVAEAAALPGFGEHGAAVARHALVLRAWVAGHLAWGVDNGRYRPSDMS